MICVDVARQKFITSMGVLGASIKVAICAAANMDKAPLSRK